MIIDHFNSNIIARKPAERHQLLEKKNKVSSDYMDYGYDYFDNNELGVGYGGYKYDGRYADVVAKIIEYYGLKKGDRILEIGCAKGFVLVEFFKQGMEVVGWDKSKYAIENAHPLVQDKIQYAATEILPFEKDTFDFVFGKEVLPHLDEKALNILIDECIRVSKSYSFFEIQCGETPEEIEDLLKWDETHQTLKTPEWWLEFFAKKGYTGDLNFKLLMAK